MGKNNQLLRSGIVLLVIAVLLGVVFTVKNNWGAAQIFVIILLALIAVMQFFIWKKFMK